MSRIVIHIGTHKTATTHLQDTFHKNRALLLTQGVTFPAIGHTNGQHGLVSSWIPMPEPYGLQNPQGAWDDLIRDHADKPGTVFISSEEFSRLAPRQVNMAQLRRMLAPFDEVRVLCTLRNQASFLQSVYQQISVERNPGAWEPFYRRALQTKRVDGLALDYNDLYDHLLAGFPPEEIRFISFDSAIKGDGGIIGAYLRALELSLRADDLEPFSERLSNVSDDALATLVANMVADANVARPGLVAWMRQALDQSLGAERPRSTVYNRVEVEEMGSSFSPLNERLARRLQANQPEFSVGPMLGGKLDLGFRDTLSDEFWTFAHHGIRRA
ncbi:hypothetical protein KTN05_12305 [Paracoccus sp. Z118]|uniref:hypothetical protein n=1 Tax=Paracoccus sp. Z118 TaxID=2851017 RepID=UPI001C2C65C8|nr:hypothetical protein [Paracoccus sp. Z118]MBV0892630.1 hypothetical protein [Paracoccus sp. Z118]